MLNELRAINPFTAADALSLTAALRSRRPANVAKPSIASPARTKRRTVRCTRTKEIILEISQDSHKGYSASSRREKIFTQAPNWETLRENIRVAVKSCSFARYNPDQVHLHIVRDELVMMR
jgi:hypothetical protein